MWSIRKGSWKQQTEKNNDLKGKWNYFFRISIVFSAGFCCQCSMLTVHLWWILQDVSALFLYRACCTKISCFILWLTRKQSIFSILEFPCYKESVSHVANADSRATVQRKKQPQETQFKVLVVGETLISGGTDCTTTPALSTEWQPVCPLLVHLVAVVPPYLERATGGTMLLPVLVACRQMCFHLPCELSFVFMGTNLYLDGLVSPEPHHNAISVNFRNISQSSG